MTRPRIDRCNDLFDSKAKEACLNATEICDLKIPYDQINQCAKIIDECLTQTESGKNPIQFETTFPCGIDTKAIPSPERCFRHVENISIFCEPNIMRPSQTSSDSKKTDASGKFQISPSYTLMGRLSTPFSSGGLSHGPGISVSLLDRPNIAYSFGIGFSFDSTKLKILPSNISPGTETDTSHVGGQLSFGKAEIGKFSISNSTLHVGRGSTNIGDEPYGTWDIGSTTSKALHLGYVDLGASLYTGAQFAGENSPANQLVIALGVFLRLNFGNIDYNYTVYHTAVTNGPFVVGESITGGTSGSKGVVTSVEDGYLTYTADAGTFVTDEVITGGTSKATTTISITPPNGKKFNKQIGGLGIAYGLYSTVFGGVQRYFMNETLADRIEDLGLSLGSVSSSKGPSALTPVPFLLSLQSLGGVLGDPLTEELSYNDTLFYISTAALAIRGAIFLGGSEADKSGGLSDLQDALVKRLLYIPVKKDLTANSELIPAGVSWGINTLLTLIGAAAKSKFMMGTAGANFGIALNPLPGSNGVEKTDIMVAPVIPITGTNNGIRAGVIVHSSPKPFAANGHLRLGFEAQLTSQMLLPGNFANLFSSNPNFDNPNATTDLDSAVFIEWRNDWFKFFVGPNVKIVNGNDNTANAGIGLKAGFDVTIASAHLTFGARLMADKLFPNGGGVSAAIPVGFTF